MRKIFLLLALCLPLLAQALEARRLADGVYAFIATETEPSPENGGFTANGGFLVGKSGVVLINPGPSLKAAKAREKAVRQVTSQPVRLVIVTHAKPEQVLGAGHFSARRIPVLATPDTVRLIKTRCEMSFVWLTGQVGMEAMKGTKLVVPEARLADGQTLDIGGRRIQIIAPDKAMMPGNTAVLDSASGVLFAGVLASPSHVPDLSESDPAGLVAALDRLATLPLHLILPDQGEPADPKPLTEIRRYVAELNSKVDAAYKAGKGLAEIGSSVPMPDFAPWQDYAIRHQANARYIHQRLEKAEFDGN